MSKALRIKIIDYLRENDAVTKYIDIRAHVLRDNDSAEQRNELKATLDYLSNSRLIAVNGSYEFLHWTVSYGLYNLDGKVISAKLTKTGQAYHPENESDEMEAFVPPVLAVIKKKGEDKKQAAVHGGDTLTAVAETEVAEPEPLPWYAVPDEHKVAVSETPTPPAEPEPLPWYEVPNEYKAPVTETVPSPAEPEPLPWYVIPEEEKPPVIETSIPTVEPEPLPWYVIPEEEKPPVAETAVPPVESDPEPLPWYVVPKEDKHLTTYLKSDEPEAFEAEMLTDATAHKSEPLPEEKLPSPVEEPVRPAAKPNKLEDILKELEGYKPLQPWDVGRKEQAETTVNQVEDKAVEKEPAKVMVPPVPEAKQPESVPSVAEIEPVKVEPVTVPIVETEPVQVEPVWGVPVPEPVAESEPIKVEPVWEAPVTVPVAESEPIKVEPIWEAPVTVPVAESEPVKVEPVWEAPVAIPVAASTPEKIDLPKEKELPAVAAEINTPKAVPPVLQFERPAPIMAETIKQPVVYKFPPLEPKPESVVRPQPAPMVIERLNQNLSHGIDAISNIKLKKPAMLTGDFEQDTNVILKFVLVVVLFLLFGCIVWLYMG